MASENLQQMNTLPFAERICDHNCTSEPYKSKFYDGLKCAVNEAGGKVIFFDTYVMYLAKSRFNDIKKYKKRLKFA